MDKTAEVLIGMLTENTGTHFLDSGGAYGRHWEQNQERNFESEPESILRFEVSSHPGQNGWIEMTHNVYHWLHEKLEYAPELDELFNQFAGLPENEDYHWLQLMEKFPDWLIDQKLIEEAGGIYGEGNPMTINTYNGEDMLSQILQYTYMELDGLPEDEDSELDLRDAYILLQIHGGCDARGGYTKPVAFRVCEEISIFDNARGSISCSNGDECGRYGRNWSTDDAYNWYEDNRSWSTPNLEKHEFLGSEKVAEEIGLEISMEDIIWWVKMAESQADAYACDEVNAFSFIRHELLQMAEEGGKNGFMARMVYKFMHNERVLLVDESTHEGFCPYCYSKLEGGYY